MISAENSPYAQTGGLSQAVSLLAHSLIKAGNDVRVFQPKYGQIYESVYPMQMELNGMVVPTGQEEKSPYPKSLVCNIKSRLKDKINIPTYFLENQEYFELRSNIYGYGDEHVRFMLLSLGCLEWLLTSTWQPDVIHAHDWHTGYLVEKIKTDPRYKKLRKIKVLYTVHNFRHQGNFNFRFAEKPDTGKGKLKPLFDPALQYQNPLLRGLIYADWINTVSQSHALEVQTPELGDGLDKYLRKYSKKFSGISNGIDTVAMNPSTDKNLAFRYKQGQVKQRQKNKPVLQKIFNLPIKPDVPLLAFVGRLAPQKGIDLILEVLSHMDGLPEFQFVFLGNGVEHYHMQILDLARKHKDRVAAFLSKDFVLPRKIFAGADMTLVPSIFEPGGIVAMEALRYGCVPIVARTGGLAETVQEFSIKDKTGNGFLHKRNDFWNLTCELVRALTIYEDKLTWEKLVSNAMAADFSWDKTAMEYVGVYKKIVASR